MNLNWYCYSAAGCCIPSLGSNISHVVLIFIPLTKTTAAHCYHRVRGLYFLEFVLAGTIPLNIWLFCDDVMERTS